MQSENKENEELKVSELVSKNKKFFKSKLITKSIIAIILLIGGVYLFSSIEYIDNNKSGEEMNYTNALYYVTSYANFQKIPLEDVFDVKNANRFRGSVYNVEFEYNTNDNILIARGYIDQSSYSFLRDDIWEIMLEIDKGKESKLVKKIFPGTRLDLSGRTFELDKTINEIFEDQLYRLNLRMDFKDALLSRKEFVEKINDLAMESLLWDKNYFFNVIDYANSIMFPLKAKSYLESFSKSHGLGSPIVIETEDGFHSDIDNIHLSYDYNSQDFSVSKMLRVKGNIDDNVSYYNSKIDQDLDWFYDATIEKKSHNLFLIILMGEYGKSDEETIKTIDSIIEKVSLWQKELES